MKKNTKYNLNFLIVSDDVSKRGNSEFTDFIQPVQYTIFLQGEADKQKRLTILQSTMEHNAEIKPPLYTFKSL